MKPKVRVKPDSAVNAVAKQQQHHQQSHLHTLRCQFMHPELACHLDAVYDCWVHRREPPALFAWEVVLPKQKGVTKASKVNIAA